MVAGAWGGGLGRGRGAGRRGVGYGRVAPWGLGGAGEGG